MDVHNRQLELIKGVQLLNSFIIFMTFDITKEYLLTLFDISKTISYNSLGRIYKPASIHIKGSLENRLKREEHVEGIVENNRHIIK